MNLVDIPLIDCHTHIGHLPGVVGEVFSPQDLLYLAEQQGVCNGPLELDRFQGSERGTEWVRQYVSSNSSGVWYPVAE